MDRRNAFLSINDITPEELYFLNQITASFSGDQVRDFVFLYSGKRKKAQEILIFTLLGLILVAGVQRFVLGQILMGVLYFLTFGFCYIGTIVDIINHKSMTNDYNHKMAVECAQLVSP